MFPIGQDIGQMSVCGASGEWMPKIQPKHCSSECVQLCHLQIQDSGNLRPNTNVEIFASLGLPPTFIKRVLCETTYLSAEM